MGLFDFFKKGDKVKNETTIDSKSLVKGNTIDKGNHRDIVTKLSIHPDWHIPQEQQYIFNFLANELKPLKPNQLSVATISAEEDAQTGDWHVRGFFRSSLPDAIDFEEIEIYLLDENEKLMASRRFNFKELGTIPPESARPWVFTFDEADKRNKEAKISNDWRLAFNIVYLRGHELELDNAWKEQLSSAQQAELKEIVLNLPPLKEDEINLTGLQQQTAEDGNLHVTVLVRNGSYRGINLEQLPLEVYDVNSKRVASGSFTLNPPLTVSANATKPWTFVFPKELVDMTDADMTRWSARVAQQ